MLISNSGSFPMLLQYSSFFWPQLHKHFYVNVLIIPVFSLAYSKRQQCMLFFFHFFVCVCLFFSTKSLFSCGPTGCRRVWQSRQCGYVPGCNTGGHRDWNRRGGPQTYMDGGCRQRELENTRDETLLKSSHHVWLGKYVFWWVGARTETLTWCFSLYLCLPLIHIHQN